MSRIVVKVGGAVAAQSAEAVLELARDNEVCVVHGAGPQISLEMERAGIPVEFVGGRRVTTPAGHRDRARVARSRQRGALRGDRRARRPVLRRRDRPRGGTPVPELGLVGDAIAADLPALDAGARRGQDPGRRAARRGPLNVNADDAAAAIAVGMRRTGCSSSPTSRASSSTARSSTRSTSPTPRSLLAGGTLEGAILPKLGAAITAARAGVDGLHRPHRESRSCVVRPGARRH